MESTKWNYSLLLLCLLLLDPSPGNCAPPFSETLVTTLDQDGAPLADVRVTASYGCKTFNPVDSAGWKSEASFIRQSDARGTVRLKGHAGSMFRIPFPCHKIIRAFKKGYAPLESGHSFSSYSPLGLCLREFFHEKPDERAPHFRSPCQASVKLDTRKKEAVIKLYKLKTCETLRAGISKSQSRQNIARDIETLAHCLPQYSIAERQTFYPVLSSLLSRLPDTIQQPLFEDEAIYENSLRSLGYLCRGSAERVELLRRWMRWSANIEKTQKAGWGPILLAREAAKSLAMFDTPSAISAVREHLEFEREYFYQRFPHLRDKALPASHQPWKIPENLEHERSKLCETKTPLPPEFYEQR